MTLVDALLAGAVLVGLVLNALLGWWWADPMASLVQKIRDGFRFFKAIGSAKPETPIDLLH